MKQIITGRDCFFHICVSLFLNSYWWDQICNFFLFFVFKTIKNKRKIVENREKGFPDWKNTRIRDFVGINMKAKQ